MKNFFIIVIVFFISCTSNKSKNFADFKSNYKKAEVDTINGVFYSDSEAGDKNMIFNFDTDDKYLISYVSADANRTDTLIINNFKYPLDNSNNIFVDTALKKISLRIIETTVYKIHNNSKNYLIFDSYSVGMTGKGVNNRYFIIFYIKNDLIVNYKVFVSWAGDANNFIISERGELDFIKITPVSYINEDSCIYEIKFINVETQKTSKNKYKVLEIYDHIEGKYNYQYHK